MFNNIKRTLNNNPIISLNEFTSNINELMFKMDMTLEIHKKTSSIERKKYLNDKISKSLLDYVNSLKTLQNTYKEIEQKASMLSPENRKKVYEMMKKLKL